jgi:Skp family chaperone for outer membrane proteins
MEPIIKSVQAKVDEIAKEKGYTYIFRLESSLHEPKEANISDAVLQKFGVTPPPVVEKKEN